MIKKYLKYTVSLASVVFLFSLLVLSFIQPNTSCEKSFSYQGIPASCNVYSATIG